MRNEHTVGGIGGGAKYFNEPATVSFAYGPYSTIDYPVDLDVSCELGTLGLPSLLGRDILDKWRIEYDPRQGILNCTV